MNRSIVRLVLAALALGSVAPSHVLAQGGLGFIAADGPDGCLKAWIAIDRGADGAISRADARLTASSEFANVNPDGNDLVTLEEWTGCEGNPVFSGVLPPVRPPQPPADPSVLPWHDEDDFLAADQNRDGAVTREEAIEAERARYAGLTITISENDIARASGRRFLMLDADGDGTLTAAEWAKRDEATIAHRLARFDLDHDGAIHFDEWTSVTRDTLLRSASADGNIDLWKFYYEF